MDFTIATTTDGFGAQYQKILQTYIFCKLNNLNFLYKPFSIVEHNYDNDINYVDKIENLINLKNNITNINPSDTIRELDYNSIVRPFFESNIDLCCESEHMKFIKDCLAYINGPLSRSLKATDTELINIKDEMLAELNKLLYLFSLK